MSVELTITKILRESLDQQLSEACFKLPIIFSIRSGKFRTSININSIFFGRNQAEGSYRIANINLSLSIPDLNTKEINFELDFYDGQHIEEKIAINGVTSNSFAMSNKHIKYQFYYNLKITNPFKKIVKDDDENESFESTTDQIFDILGLIPSPVHSFLERPSNLNRKLPQVSFK